MAAKSNKDSSRRPGEIVNKKAYRDFYIAERFDAGLSLAGSEVKSLRAGAADIKGSYARIEEGQCWLVGATIAHYEQAGVFNHEPKRKRKLLLHKAQIRKIREKVEHRGFTLVPLRIYFNEKSLAKIELALARGKRQYDKRRSIGEREQKKDIDRSIKKYKKK